MKLTTPLVLVFSLAACGDDGGSGVDPDKALSEVTIEDATDVCEASLGNAEDDFLLASCTVDGIVAEAQEEGDCETVRDECVDNPAPDEDDDFGCDIDQDDIDDLEDCTSTTVADLEACLGDFAESFVQVRKDITCDMTPAELEAYEFPDDPASCDELEEKCPGFS